MGSRKIILLLLLAMSLALGARSVFAQPAPAKAGDWDRVIETAKKEGKVVVSIPPSPELRKGMEMAFTRRTGVGVEFVPARGGAIIQRMVSEAKAQMQYFDVHVGGTESIVSGLLPANILEPVEPLFAGSDVKDAKQWWGGHFWVDNAKRFVYPFVAYQTVSLWCNPNEYKASEVQSFDDLLSAKLKGRIGMSDPRVSGAGNSMWSHMLAVKGEEYLKRLMAQNPFVARDLRLLGDNLSKGKVAVTVGIGYSELLPFIKVGLPIAPLPTPREGVFATSGYGNLVVFKNAPHPSAAKVFVNWLLSRDGQEIYGRAMGVASRRLDVDTRWTKDFGVIGAKDGLSVEQYRRLENQSEAKIYKLREPGSTAARKLLGS